MPELSEYMKAGAIWAHQFSNPAESPELFTTTNVDGVEETVAGRGLSFANGGIAWGTRAHTAREYVWDDVHYAYDGSDVYTGGVLTGSEPITVTATGFSGATGTLSYMTLWDALGAADIALMAVPSVFAYRSTLAHHWRMASNNPLDDVGSANGTDVGNPTVTRTGNGYALAFDGTNDAVHVGALGLVEGDPQTIIVRFSTVGAAYAFSSRVEGVGGLSMHVAASRKLQAIIGNTTQAEASTAITAGQMVTAAVVYDGDAVAYYLDGDADGTDTSLTGTWDATTVSHIAARGDGGGTVASELTGDVADVRIYRAALTPLQIKHATWEIEHNA